MEESPFPAAVQRISGKDAGTAALPAPATRNVRKGLADAIAAAPARVGIAALSFVFILTRVVFLDGDLPPWYTTFHSAIDEFYYTIPAFNLYHYGRLAHQVVPLGRDDSWPVNLLQIVMTFVGLKLFGNTYFGLRIASVVAGFGALALLYFILKRAVAGSASGLEAAHAGPARHEWTALFWLLVLALNFPFLVASRVAEPTVFSMLALCAVMYLCTLEYFTSGMHLHRSALLGLAATASMIFVYVYNAFVPLGVFIAVVYWGWQSDRRKVWLHALAYLAGAAACVGAYALFIWVTYRTTLIQAIVTWYLPFRTSARLPGPSLGSIPDALRTLLTTNIFRFNWALLLFFLLALPVFAYSSLARKDRLGVAVLALTGTFVVQSMVVNDYSYRKFLVLLPLVVVTIATAFSRRDDTLTGMRASRQLRTWAAIYASLASLGVFVLYWRYSHAILLAPTTVYRIETNKIVSQPFAMFGIANYLNLLSLGVAGALVVGYFLWGRWPARSFAALAIVALAVPNLYLASHFVFANPSFGYRDAMIAAGRDIDGKIVAGGLSYGMRLYNTSQPVMNGYVWANDPTAYNWTWRRLFDEDVADSSFSYTDPKTQARMAEVGLYLEKEYSFRLPRGKFLGRYVPKARLRK